MGEVLAILVSIIGVQEMEAKFLTKEKDLVEVQVNDCDEGMMRLIVGKLSADKKVGFIAVTLDHPLTSNPVLRVKAANAKEAIEKAIDASMDEITEALKKSKSLA